MKKKNWGEYVIDAYKWYINSKFWNIHVCIAHVHCTTFYKENHNFGKRIHMLDTYVFLLNFRRWNSLMHNNTLWRRIFFFCSNCKLVLHTYHIFQSPFSSKVLFQLQLNDISFPVEHKVSEKPGTPTLWADSYLRSMRTCTVYVTDNP